MYIDQNLTENQVHGESGRASPVASWDLDV